MLFASKEGLKECFLDKILEVFFKVGMLTICGWALDNLLIGKKLTKKGMFLNFDSFNQINVRGIFYGKW